MRRLLPPALWPLALAVLLGGAAATSAQPREAPAAPPVSLWAHWLQFEASDVGVTCLAFSPDGRRLAAGQNDGRVWVWEVATGRELALLGEPGDDRAVAVAFSADGCSLFLARQDGLLTFDARDWERGESHAWGDGKIVSAAFDPAHGRLALGTGEGQVRVWDLAKNKELHRFTAHAETVFSLRFSPDGQYLATGSVDRTDKLWRVGDWANTATFKSEDQSIVRGLALTRDAGTLVSVGSHDGLRVWDAAAGRLTAKLKATTHPFAALDLHPDGHTAAAGSHTGHLQLWDIQTGDLVVNLFDHRGMVFGVAFSPDGSMAASCGVDGLVNLYDAGRRVATRTDGDPAVTVLLERLKQEDPRGLQAVLELAAHPDRTLHALRKQIALQEIPSRERVADLVADLASDNYRTRSLATEELKRMGQIARDELHKALTRNATLEFVQRATLLLKELERPVTPDELRRLRRTVAVLYRIGNPEAREMLEQITMTIPIDAVVDDARTALARLRRLDEQK